MVEGYPAVARCGVEERSEAPSGLAWIRYLPQDFFDERALTSREKKVVLKRLEARVRIELTHKGFADLSLTAWVPRLIVSASQKRNPSR